MGGAAKDVINVKGTAVDARSSIIGDNGKITLQTSSADLLSIESSDFDFGGEDQIHLTTGTNVVIAGNGDDSITAQAGINVILGDDGMAEFYTDGSLRLIESINLGTGGDDIIALSDGINDVIAGAGSDTITVRGRGVTNGINGDEGRLELLADDSGTNLIRKLNGPTGDSSGLDVMNVLPTNEVSESSHLTGNLLTGLNMESQILYLALEVLNIELNDATSKVIIENTHNGETKLTTSGGEDLVEVLATAGPTHIRTGLDRDIVSIQSIGAMMTVRTGSSSDVVNVGSLAPKTGGLLDGIQGPLSVDGELGDDQLNLDDSGDRSQNIGHLTSSVLTGLGVSDDITYFVEELNIDLGTARDVFNIQSSHIGETNLTTSTGKDTVNVLSTAGMTHVDTGDDEDVVNIQSIGALMTVRTGAHNDSVRLGSLVPVSGGLLDGVSASLLIDGEEGEDRLDVDDSGDGLPNSGQLTSSLLTGLGMSDEVNYFVEELSIKLGTAGDSFTIEETHANRTKISMGAGDDRAAIASTSGPLQLEGELGDDTVHLATSDINGEISADEGFLEKIMGHLVFDGGGGVDRITANDSNDSSSETGTLTENSLTGFGFNSAPEVQTLTVVGESGFYRISRGEVNVPWYNIRPGVARPNALGVALDVQFSAGQIQDHLELIYGATNVSVKLISEGLGIKTYGIAFIGELAGTEVAPIRWVDPGPINLVANTHSRRAEIIIDTYTSVADSSPHHTQQFLEIIDSDRGTFTITLLDQTTDPLPFNITLEALTNALEPILNPNNIDRAMPFTDNFNIEIIGDRFLITFKAEHRDLAINGVDINVNELRGGTVNLETYRSGVSYLNLEQVDLYFGDGIDVLNIQGTSATTNIDLGGGDDEVYVSSLSDIDFVKRDHSFIGNLDEIGGTLNIDGGSGDQKILISDASSVDGDFVSVIDRLPLRNMTEKDLNWSSELFIIGASPAPISVQADRVDGSFRNGFKFETGSGDDTINITTTFFRNRILDAGKFDLDTGLGNDNVYASLTADGNSPLIINTESEFNYRMIMRSVPNLADLTDPEDNVSVIVDGVRLSKDQFRVVIDLSAIDLKIDGDLSTDAVVEVQVSRVSRGRVAEVPGQRQYTIDYRLHESETVKLFSAGEELLQGVDYFFYQIRPQQFILVFNGRFNFFRNGDIIWEATRIFSEFQTVQSLGQRDDDFVNASGSTLPLSIFTGSGNDVVIGGQGDDFINSGRGDDIVFGRSGSDQIISVEGNQLGEDLDIIFGDDGIVKFKHFPRQTTIDSRNAGQQRLPLADYRLSEVFSVDGGTAGDDVITSGNGDAILIGGFGADQLTSGDGSDILIGDSGKVILKSGHPSQIESTDSFDQSGTNDVLSGGDGVNYLIGGLGNDEISTGFTDVSEFSLILGDLGEISFDYKTSTGINSVTRMASSFPGFGGDDKVSSSGSSAWIITGSGMDQLVVPYGAFFTLGIGSFTPAFANDVLYHEWTILRSFKDSTGKRVITLDGYILEQRTRLVDNPKGEFYEL